MADTRVDLYNYRVGKGYVVRVFDREPMGINGEIETHIAMRLRLVYKPSSVI